jgi:glutamyl-Q tRNA(Asp) synthetase
LGHQSYNPASLGGDPILQRKDGLFAYHWAVVVDDEQQGITDVVRGQDLLDQTSIHLSLQQAAKFPQLKYAHLPLITGEDKQKLSKSERASSLSLTHPTKLICRMLVSLGQLTTREATDRTNSPMAAILADAASRWDIEQIPKITSLSAQVLLG